MIDILIFSFLSIVFLLLISIRQVNQYERGLLFSFGKFTSILQPGWRIVLPIIQGLHKVDIRVKAVDVPDQEAITKDNVSTKINAVIYYKVVNPELAILAVENFFLAVSELAQTTMRNIVGEVTLDQLLSEREMVSEKIREIIDKATDPWGIKVENVDLKDVSLPSEMKRVIARQAEAEREKRAVITMAEGEAIAAENLSKAAEMLARTPGALHLRTLNSINDISSDQSNTIVFAVPLEVLRALEGISNFTNKNNHHHK